MDDQGFGTEIAVIQLPRKVEHTETPTQNANLSTSTAYPLFYSAYSEIHKAFALFVSLQEEACRESPCSCVTVIPMTVAGLGDDVILKKPKPCSTSFCHGMETLPVTNLW